MSRNSLRAWLQKDPLRQPTHLVFDQTELYELGIGRDKWRNAENAVSDKGVRLVEAVRLDRATGERVSLRTFRVEVPEDEEEQAAPPKSVALSPSQSDLQVVAALIANAHSQGAKDHAAAYSGLEAAYKTGFTELTKLVHIVSDRMQALEAAWMAQLNAQAQEAAKLKQEAEEAILEAKEAQEDDATGELGKLVGAVAERFGVVEAEPEAKPKPRKVG